MSSGVEKLLPFDCLNIYEFLAMHMNIHTDAHEYKLESPLINRSYCLNFNEKNLIISAGDISSLSNLLVKYFIFCFSRWIRLLFGREFPMQDLLVLWDAIFADGIGFDLVDYIFVAMLLYIRDHCKLTGCFSFHFKPVRGSKKMHPKMLFA